MLVSSTDRDGRPGSSRSTWGKRLGAGTRRPAWLLEATRVPAVVS